MKCLFMQSESLAYLTLDTVTVDSMLEVFLRYTDQQLYGRFVSRTLLYHIYHPQWKRNHRLTASSAKERFYQLPADYTLTLGQRGTCIVEHGRPLTLLNKQIVLEGSRHGRILLRGCFNIKAQTGRKWR